jgi:hypothetical protein
MNVYIGGAENQFLGKITEISVHNTIRSESYIFAASEMPTSLARKVVDNGDRLVILKYFVSQDFNYQGGNVKIIRKEAIGTANFDYQEPQATGATSEVITEPYLILNGYGEHINNEYDGLEVHAKTAIAGETVVALPFDYVHLRNYYFRLYTQNVLGNTSLSSDSPELQISIPEFENINAKNAAITLSYLPQLNNVRFVTGNAKAYILWDEG